MIIQSDHQKRRRVIIGLRLWFLLQVIYNLLIYNLLTLCFYLVKSRAPSDIYFSSESSNTMFDQYQPNLIFWLCIGYVNVLCCSCVNLNSYFGRELKVYYVTQVLYPCITIETIRPNYNLEFRNWIYFEPI